MVPRRAVEAQEEFNEEAIAAALRLKDEAEEFLQDRARAAGVELSSLFIWRHERAGLEINFRAARGARLFNGGGAQPVSQGLAFSLEQFDEEIAVAKARLAAKKGKT